MCQLIQEKKFLWDLQQYLWFKLCLFPVVWKLQALNCINQLLSLVMRKLRKCTAVDEKWTNFFSSLSAPEWISSYLKSYLFWFLTAGWKLVFLSIKTKGNELLLVYLLEWLFPFIVPTRCAPENHNFPFFLPSFLCENNWDLRKVIFRSNDFHPF